MTEKPCVRDSRLGLATEEPGDERGILGIAADKRFQSDGFPDWRVDCISSRADCSASGYSWERWALWHGRVLSLEEVVRRKGEGGVDDVV